jgi:hypothetical protein
MCRHLNTRHTSIHTCASAVARDVVHAIRAHATVVTGVRGAIVDVGLTPVTRIASSSAVASHRVHAVSTETTVLAWVRRTVVDVVLASVPRETTPITVTVVCVHAIGTHTTIQAGGGGTFLNILVTNVAASRRGKSSRTGAAEADGAAIATRATVLDRLENTHTHVNHRTCYIIYNSYILRYSHTSLPTAHGKFAQSSISSSQRCLKPDG